MVTRELADLREKLARFYSDTGRPSIDPETHAASGWGASGGRVVNAIYARETQMAGELYSHNSTD